jgi:hypothetical protein
MIRLLLLFLLGYIIWTVFRLFQRTSRMRQSGWTDKSGVQSTGSDQKPKSGFPEIRDAEFEDLDPKKGDGT